MNVINHFSHVLKRARSLPKSGGRLNRQGGTYRLLNLDVDPVVVYAIGDVHGCLDKMKVLERQIFQHGQSIDAKKLIIYLGDYIDRGPQTANVLQQMLQPSPAGFQKVALRGNHEQMLLDVLEERQPIGKWLRFGGKETLLSYGIDADYLLSRGDLRQKIVEQELLRSFPESHLDFLKSLPLALSTPSYLFVHAGVRPNIALEKQRAMELMGIREPFLSANTTGFSQLVIHGHTPSEVPVLNERRVCVDTGACYGGPLTAAIIQPEGISFLSA